MSSINFYLDKPDRKGKKPIVLTYFLNGKKVRFFTKLKTSDKDWNATQQRIKKNGEGQSEINFLLSEFTRSIEKIEHDCLSGYGKVSIELIKEKLLEKTGSVQKGSHFFEVFEEYIISAQNIKMPNTIKGYKATLQKLKEFEERRRSKIDFDSIDVKFYDKFIDFLLVEQNLVNNSIGKYVKNLKSFLSFATDRGVNKNYEFKKFKVFQDDADIIYLSSEELFRLYDLKDLPQRLEQVKDLFCLRCFTGLRFSDLSKLKETNIVNGFIELRTIKTRDILKIPLNKFALEIMDKYAMKIPPAISNQKMNDYLKELGEIAQINKQIVLSKYKGATKIEVTKPKYEFISTHTARRTFVALSLEKGMRPEIVMSITGHKDYSTFKKYIKLTENVKLAEMNNVWGN